MDMGQRKMSNFRTPINARYNVVAFITKLPKCKRVASTRAKKILEQISKPCFFTEFKNRGLFSTATQQRRNSVKKRDIESCSCIFFPSKHLAIKGCDADGRNFRL